MSTRNTVAGHNWERKCINLLKEIWKDIASCRFVSRSLDYQKIDICKSDGTKLPINIQCKNTVNSISYNNILNTMPENEDNVIFHNRTKKSEKGRFMSYMQLVVCNLEVGYKLIGNIQFPISNIYFIDPVKELIAFELDSFIKLLKLMKENGKL